MMSRKVGRTTIGGSITEGRESTVDEFSEAGRHELEHEDGTVLLSHRRSSAHQGGSGRTE
jgi:hypothetical protein